MKDYNDVEVLEKVLTLWIHSIDCVGLECKSCNKNNICKMVTQIFKEIKEITTYEEI